MGGVSGHICLKRAPWTFLSLYQLKKVTCICNNMTVSNSMSEFVWQLFLLKWTFSIDQCVLKKHFYSVSNLQLSGARLNRSPPLHHFWASNLFSWLNHLYLPILSGMKDPHAQQRTNIIRCDALWRTSVTWSENKMQFSVSVVFSQTQESLQLPAGCEFMCAFACVRRDTYRTEVFIIVFALAWRRLTDRGRRELSAATRSRTSSAWERVAGLVS